jgi:C-terminal processing protease CtpA/Prc
MNDEEVSEIVEHVRTLLETSYLFPDVAAAASRVLADALAVGRYPADLRSLAEAVTADLQSVNGDKHLRLLYHDDAQPAREPGSDREEYAAMVRWADQTSGGVARAQRLAGNVGYLDLQPVLFPAAISGELITAAMSLIASTEALIVDLRRCLGGEPGAVSLIASYLWDREPVQLSGLREREALTQAWTLPYVPGRRFGQVKPVYVLTSGATFSAAEQLSYDLQQLGRATIVGEQTRGGAHAREGFIVHPHLEATISVAAAVHPKTGGNWEGTGVTPDVPTTAGQALDTAYRRALQDVIAVGGAGAAEAQSALDAAAGQIMHV